MHRRKVPKDSKLVIAKIVTKMNKIGIKIQAATVCSLRT
jgi:hypothetical protein